MSVHLLEMKEHLLKYIKFLLDERMAVAQQAMQSAQDSANEETKSSAGDKYETGRAMAQNQRDMYARQYEQIRQERQVLERIEGALPSQRVSFGTIVNTTVGVFFVSVSIGLIQWEGQPVMVVSPGSPIGKLLLGKEIGDDFVFQGKKAVISSME